MTGKLAVLDIGRKPYQETYRLQLKLLQERLSGQICDTLILVEHPPVITMGSSGTENNIIVPEEVLAAEGVEVFKIDRGGNNTYHGPGQLVGYPILNLRDHKKDLHWLIRSYEEVFIRLLQAEFGISAGRIKDLTGVWVGQEKITAIGIGVKHWVTLHGFAFNVNPDLKHFNFIIPCGITDKGVTSLEKILPDYNPDFQQIKQITADYFARVFEMELVNNAD